MSEADRFLGSVQAAYRRDDLNGIARLLDPLSSDTLRVKASLNVGWYMHRSQLSQDLADPKPRQANPHLRPSSYTSHAKAFFSDNLPFADFVAAFLLFVRDTDVTADNAQSALNAYELLSSCYRYIQLSELLQSSSACIYNTDLVCILAWRYQYWLVKNRLGSFQPYENLQMPYPT